MKLQLQLDDIVLKAAYAVVTGHVVSPVNDLAGQHPFNFPVERADALTLEPGQLYDIALTPVKDEGGKS